jgi:hypothetical protein
MLGYKFYISYFIDPFEVIQILLDSGWSVVFWKNIKYICDVYFLEDLIMPLKCVLKWI